MALLAVKKVLQGRISMEDFSCYLVARIQNCRLLKCYLLFFSLSSMCLIIIFFATSSCFSLSYVCCAFHGQQTSVYLLSYASLKCPKGIAFSGCGHSWVEMGHCRSTVRNNVYLIDTLSLNCTDSTLFLCICVPSYSFISISFSCLSPLFSSLEY